MIYIRFVVDQRDPNSGRRQGLFHALGALQRQGILSSQSEAEKKALYKWFDDHLEAPTRFSKARRSHPKSVSLSWFKSTATKHIAKMRRIAEILEMHHVRVHEIKTERPGYIVYEDEHQISAQPFYETPT